MTAKASTIMADRIEPPLDPADVLTAAELRELFELEALAHTVRRKTLWRTILLSVPPIVLGLATVVLAQSSANKADAGAAEALGQLAIRNEELADTRAELDRVLATVGARLELVQTLVDQLNAAAVQGDRDTLVQLAARLRALTEESLGVARGSAGILPATAIPPPWLEIAVDELGVTELPGPESNPQIVEYLRSINWPEPVNDDFPWGVAFVNWALSEAGLEGTNSPSARSWLEWGVPIRLRLGCVAVVRTAGDPSAETIGFYLDRGDGQLRILAGNVGNAVAIATVPDNAFVDCRWPPNFQVPGL